MSTAVRAALETVHGTAVTTGMVDLPVNFSAHLAQDNWTPEEMRNAQDINFATAVSVHHEVWEIADSPIYTDSIGVILASAFGPVASGVYKLADDPKSLTFQWSQRKTSIQGFQSAGCVVDRFGLKFDANGDLTFNAAGLGMPETLITAPVHAFTDTRPMAVWRGVVTKGGAAYDALVSGGITVARNRRPFHTIRNLQAPKKITIGDRSVDFNIEVEFASMTDYNLWKAATTEALSIEWTDGAASFEIAIPKAAYKTAEPDDAGDTPILRLVGKGLYDPTAATKIMATVA